MMQKIYKSEVQKELMKIAEETNPRFSSETVEDIKNKYDLKMEYNNDKRPIMEQAHPEPVVLDDAYDPLNALIENNIERHNIMVNIISRDPSGALTNKKYAEAQLLKELVRIANDLDNRGHEKLAKLADTVVEQLTITKEAFAFIPVLIGAGVLATIAIVNHFYESDQGVYKNTERAISELNDVVNQDDISVVARNEFQRFINVELSPFKTVVHKYNDLDPVHFDVDPKNDDNMKEIQHRTVIINEYYMFCQRLIKEIPIVVSNVNKVSGAQMGDDENNFTSMLKDLWHMFSPTDFKEATKALNALKSSCEAAVKDLTVAKNTAEKSQHDAMESPKAKKTDSAPEKHEETPTKTTNDDDKVLVTSMNQGLLDAYLISLGR